MVNKMILKWILSQRKLRIFQCEGGGADPKSVYSLCLILKTMF